MGIGAMPAEPVRVLALSDEVDPVLAADPARAGRADLIVACGDLPFDYLADVMNGVGAPLVFVPGNHDPDLHGYRQARSGLVLKAGLPAEPPWPPGAVNADGHVVDVGGLRVAGLGGSARYSDGPNQYTDRQQAARARRLLAAARWRQWRDGRPVDLILSHSPPRGLGDEEDPAHRGFTALHHLIAALQPQYLLHGHVAFQPDRRIGGTVVRNVIGRHVLEIGSGMAHHAS
jgi:hypothetical protein